MFVIAFYINVMLFFAFFDILNAVLRIMLPLNPNPTYDEPCIQF